MPGQRQWLERLGSREPVRTTGALDAARAEREAELGYVALAGALGCPLVTGDLRLARAPGLGVLLVAV